MEKPSFIGVLKEATMASYWRIANTFRKKYGMRMDFKESDKFDSWKIGWEKSIF